MYREKCLSCKGKGKIVKIDKLWGKIEGMCYNCLGRGYHLRKNKRELMREFKESQDWAGKCCDL